MTLGELLDQIKADLDIDDTENPIISDADIRRFINKAIQEAEAVIHNIHEDYFLEIANLTMTLGDKVVDFPANIYGNKIRKLFYFPSDKNARYEITQIKNKLALMDIEDGDDYQYHVINSVADGNHIELEPASRENSSNLKCLYIRNARQFATDGTEDDDDIDIPEYQRFLQAHAQYNILKKDGSPMAEEEKLVMDRYRGDMIASLTRSIPDENDLIEPDLSFYEDFNGPRFME